MIASASLVVLWAAATAYAQGRVEGLRISKNPEFDRIVLDLGIEPVEATQSKTADEFVMSLAAPEPQLALADEDRLADLRVYFEPEPAGDGSRLVVDLAGRNVRVFRLDGNPAAGKGDRLVLDIGRRGGAALTIPGDATRVPESAAVASRSPRREPPAPAPPAPEPDRAAVAPPTPAPERVAPPAPPSPPEPAREGSGPPEGEDVWVLVREIEIQGVQEAPSLEELRDLKLAVSPFQGGYVAPRADQPVQRIALRGLAGDDSNGRRLSGSVLQLIVETIAAAYARNDKLGTKVDIRRTDLESLSDPDSDGKLVIRVREASDRSASR